MFTRCPACDTTFRLSAGDLRRAQGRVRCGECSSVFNALEYLAEEPEEAGAPDGWLPEPANDATVPDDRGTPLDIYSAFNAEEPISTAGWNEALQQHEQAETGLDLTVSMRSDYLSPEELADEADNLTVSQPVLPAEPAPNEPDFDDDFDATIWERIPGVGAQSISSARPIEVSADPSAGPQQSLPASQRDADDIDPLEFNAPEETWSNIFVRGSSATTDDDDDVEEYPQILADDPETDDKDDMAGLEQIFNPERIASLLRERTDALRNDYSDDNTAAQNAAATAEDPYRANLPDPAIDISERRRAVADWLTEEDDDEEAADTAPDDELPEDGYDVQHIILADESEPADAPRVGNLRVPAAGKDDTFAWQADKESTPARNGFWLTGGLLLLTALAIQLVHYNRDSLAANPVWGDAVSRAYSLLAIDLFPAWSMADYEIRSAEVVTGESGADIMDIRAQIAVVGDTPTGLPYLRVVLSDRWSKPVAEKAFSPADYSAADNASSDRLLLPGQSIEVHVSIVDPGTGAQGFELELCLPRRHTGMECTGRPFK